MQKKALGKTGLEVVPIVFGGNVFGWTLDEKASFEILDAFVDAGFDTIDTADVYSAWAPGNKGGESEVILGKWFEARPGMRERVKLFTKVGSDLGEPGKKGLSEKWIMQAVDESLARLKTDYIDLYFSHWPDPDTGYAETLGAYEKLLKAGKIRSVGASNLNAEQLAESLKVARENSLPEYQVLQPQYNLSDRDSYEGALRDLCIREGLGVVTYFSLASGFLSGKYRTKEDLANSARRDFLGKYFDDRGTRILEALHGVADKHSASSAEVSLAWLLTREGVTAPIASGTKKSHLESFARALELSLDKDDLSALDQASAY